MSRFILVAYYRVGDQPAVCNYSLMFIAVSCIVFACSDELQTDVGSVDAERCGSTLIVHSTPLLHLSTSSRLTDKTGVAARQLEHCSHAAPATCIHYQWPVARFGDSALIPLVASLVEHVLKRRCSPSLLRFEAQPRGIRRFLLFCRFAVFW